LFTFYLFPGLDQGGLTREWFELVSRKIFDPDFGLFKTYSDENDRLEINPASGSYKLH
jgi:E3 ubiquitin-protein ligase HUWE1